LSIEFLKLLEMIFLLFQKRLLKVNVHMFIYVIILLLILLVDLHQPTN